MTHSAKQSDPCPAGSQLERLVRGELDPADEFGLRSHVDGCLECQSVMRDEARLAELRSVFRADRQQIRSAHAEGIPGYTDLCELQRGGQGVVYRAIQAETQRVVAIKLLLNGLFSTERQRARFLREIELAARLRHPNIVTVFGGGEYNGHHFCVMEFVDGVRFDKWSAALSVQAGERQRRVAALFRRLAEALGHAHAHGVLHRDLKPANVLVDTDDQPHILDFGLARDLTSDGGTLSGEFLGTLSYTSPEQASADPDGVDVRSDIYSLGVMLYESLTGTMPYEVSGALHQVIATIRDAPPPPLPSVRGTKVDPDLQTIVLKALAKEKERRYQTADALARDLGNYLAGAPIDARRDSTWYLASCVVRRHRYAFAAAVSVFATVCASLVFSLVLLGTASRERDKARVATVDADRARLAEQERGREVDRQREAAEFNAYAASIAACDAALRVADAGDAAIHLDRAPESHRNFEWWHTKRRVDGARDVLAGHASYVEDLVVLRRRPWAISIGWDRKLIVWDYEACVPLMVRELPAFGWALAVSPDESRLAIGAWDGTVRVWSLPDLRPVSAFHGPAQRVSNVAFHPDGQSVAAAFWAFDNPRESHQLVVASVGNGDILCRIPLPARGRSLHFEAGGDRVCCAFDGGTVIADPASGREVDRLETSVLATSRTGVRAELTQPTELTLRGLAAPVVCRGHTQPIVAARFDDTGERIVTSSTDQTVRVWDVADGRELHRLVGHRWQVTAAEFVSGTSLVASASWDQTVRLWDLEEQSSMQLISAHGAAVTCLVRHAGSRQIASSSRDGSVILWRARDMQRVQEFHDHTRPVQDVALSRDGAWVATASWDGSVSVRDLHSEAPAKTLRGHSDMVLAACFLGDGRTLATGSRDNRICIWDVVQGRLLRVLADHDDHIHSIRLRPDGRQFASAGHHSIRLWETATWTMTALLKREIIQEDYSLAYNPVRGELAAGTQQSIRFWDVATGESLGTVLASRDEMLSLDFSPDGSRLVSVSVDGAVRIWDVRHRIPLMLLRGAPAGVRRAIFDVDGRSVIGGLEDGRLVIWKGAEE